ncbi:uncharacterized protein EV422DRAFT_265445 [Fimicolochytrium jonesii]|uniref:uncharacterized protein n=1 Tax=Fimicolochytrium jonesii TaxID=1396493 RepID=UPI0022FDEE93|nr:uncharacterized protein EV422DRAFT_265445 [Fimicolochytrium jonesii]KAI8816911.1 hypothetical protein EV422DRAFT_265445 [Fimicolochytrium jonesii]
MEPNNKWILRSGRCVEDVMYEAGMKFKYTSNIHSFCYVNTDRNITSLFTDEEREELEETNTKCVPPFTKGGTFHNFYNKFAACGNGDALRDMLFSEQEELQSSRSTDEEFWHCQLYHSFLVDMLLLSSKTNKISEDLSEAWLLANPYRALQILFGDKEHIFFLSGEKGGVAVADRKNMQMALPAMTQMVKKCVGKKGDGYVRAFDGVVRDLAATEAGLKWEGFKGTKLMVETVKKLPRVLRDIFSSNHSRGGSQETLLRSMAVPGLAIYGPMVSLLLLDAPNGYIVRCRGSDWRELSLSISPAVIKANGMIFTMFLTMRMHVLRNEELIARAGGEDEEENDPALELLAAFGGRKKRRPTGLALPKTHPTPRKKRMSANGTVK